MAEVAEAADVGVVEPFLREPAVWAVGFEEEDEDGFGWLRLVEELAMQRIGGVYLAIVGGAAALETLQIEEIEQVWWEDLMPECLWKFRVKDFGPLIVAIDSHGNSHYRAIQERAAKRIAALEL